jgi:YD repeat-containing protein
MPSLFFFEVHSGNAKILGYYDTSTGAAANITGSFTIPDQLTGYIDTSGKSYYYDNNSKLTSYTSSDSGVTSGTWPVKNIGDNAFGGNLGMTNVFLPSSLVSIGAGAFYGSGLTSVSIPSSVQTIREGAFSTCASLSLVEFLGTRPATLESDCFYGISASFAAVPSSWTDTSNIGSNFSNGGTYPGLPVQIATRIDLSFFPDQLNVYNASAGGYISPLNIAVKGPYIYATGETNTFVSRIFLTDGSANKVQWANVGDSNGYITFDGSYLYFASRNASNISKVNLSDGSVASSTWATGLNKLTAIAANGNYIYATSFSNSNVSRINLSDGTVANAAWATGLTKPGGIAFDLSYAYVTYNSGLGAILGGNVFGGVTKINLSDGTVANPTWATGMWRPTGIAVSGAYAYVLNSGGTLGRTNYVVSQINLSDGSVATSNVATGTLAPAALAGVVSVDGSYGYIGSTSNFYISRFTLPNPTRPNLHPVFRQQGWFGGIQHRTCDGEFHDSVGGADKERATLQGVEHPK